MKYKIAGCALLFFSIGLFSYLLYSNSEIKNIPVVFSSKKMLESLWVSYKRNYIESETGRVVDRGAENITTSEGQAYALLRSVWVGDKVFFDKVWTWTQGNLQHSNNSLFSWRYGKRADGTFGILGDGGKNSATDADTDIALALIFADARWKDPVYSDSAKRIIKDIWKHETISIRGRPYLVSNDIEQTLPKKFAVSNPSYCAPYAYRIFGEVDPNHPWQELVDTCYEILGQSIELSLGSAKSAFIPPNWVLINKETGKIKAGEAPLDTSFSFDALRVSWRVALDLKWFNESRAENILSKMSFLKDEWEKNGKLASSYSHDGQVQSDEESPSVYGGAIGYFMYEDQLEAKRVYERKLILLYSPDMDSLRRELGYYDENWVWFGMALYDDQVPNLFQKTNQV